VAMSDPAEQWRLLQSLHPAAARLAVVSSLPVRVSPALLRLARLRLVDEASTGNEADLWLSSLVEARSAGGFSYRPEVRAFLRTLLAADRELLDRLWDKVHLRLAGWLTPKTRLEEEQTWRFLRDPQDPWIDENWRQVWRELQQTDNAEGVARWVVRAMANMPPRALESDAANRLWIGAHLMLGEIGVLGDQPQHFVQTGEFDFATQRLARRQIQVGLTDGGVIISPVRRIKNGHALDIPFTRPLWIQIEDHTGEVLSVLTVTGSEPVLCEVEASEFVLRLIDGAAYWLAEPKQPASDKFIGRNRAPRTQISYDIETEGAEISMQLPFVTGVVADLSGNTVEPPPPVADRKFVQIDTDNFDAVMALIRPRLEMTVPDLLQGEGEGEFRIELEFKRIEDFSPDAILEQYPALIRSGEMMSAILHHQAFQRLEGSWRGLHYLVHNTETDEHLKIRVLNVSKQELTRDLKRYAAGDWKQSPLFKKLYEEPYGHLGGEPFGCLVGDFEFDNSPVDTELLTAMSRICAAIHTPFLAGASPAIMGMTSWQELGLPRDLGKIFMMPEYAQWRSLRESEDSRYIALTMPRFLARLPYGSKTNPLRIFDTFEEETGEADTGEADTENYTWCNAAYAMAVNINRAFKTYGWCARIRGIESGGVVEGLPVHMFPTDDGGVDMKSPTEISISDRREAELDKLGFLPLIHRPNSDTAVFFGAQTLHKPPRYDQPDASANAVIASRLPFVFVCGRFAHYLMSITRDKIGVFKDTKDLEQWLNRWLSQYVDPDPGTSSGELRARKPLTAAEVVLEESGGELGFLNGRVYLQPSYQLEGLSAAMRIHLILPHP
jgi:type VI secretion system protein ImpC